MDKSFRFYESLRVFLACPGDLVAERSRFPRILDKVNTLRAHSMGFHLEAVGWERVMPSFGRPQASINRELRNADLTLVLFWNRFGVPSGRDGNVTGTQEEFDIAVARCGDDAEVDASGNRPSLCVYFREQTILDTDSAASVRAFRQRIEEEKRLLYRQYSSESEWEELVTEHLVAFLNGRQRTALEEAVELMLQVAPLKDYWQAMYSHPKKLVVDFDFDGDDKEESITFQFQQADYQLVFFKGDQGYHVRMGDTFGTFLTDTTHVHLAVKDVNADGLPELLIGAANKESLTMLGVYGWSRNEFVSLEHY